jgi:hypothetical protein
VSRKLVQDARRRPRGRSRLTRQAGLPVSVVTIVLADDHNVVRQALRTLLETESRFAVVGEI